MAGTNGRSWKSAVRCGLPLPRVLLCVFMVANCWQALSEDDSQCLKQFKDSVQDPKGYLSNWIFSSSVEGYVCSFNGVSCWNVKENKVLGLKLHGAGLSGRFPSGLVQCKALQNLDLSQNNFSGAIPDDLCVQLPYVTLIDLSSNNFSGLIPVELEDCQYLHSLLLQQNQLSGMLPGGIGILPKLITLNVSSNLLVGPIPSSYSNRSSAMVMNPGSGFPASSFSNNPGLCGPPLRNPCSAKSKTSLIVGTVVPSVALLCGLILLCVHFIARKEERAILDDEHSWAKRIRIGAPQLVTAFLFDKPLKELKLSDLMGATNNFAADSISCAAPSGTVYKALLPDGSMLAVKRLRACRLADDDFQSEMEKLGGVRHKNLVPLLGYCRVGRAEKLLVYKDMVNGSLRQCLHDAPAGRKPGWVARLKIGLGAARGLAWLHHSCNPRIIHRNISSNTILLDEQEEPRITDFGLARLMHLIDTHISPSVHADFGDVGYVPPEYPITLLATVRGDVYSFGVVLLELITGRRASDVCAETGFPGNLADWVLFLSSSGRIEEALDMSLRSEAMLEEEEDALNQFVRIGCACVVPEARDRPTMYEVYQLIRSIGEKFAIADDEVIVIHDCVIHTGETDD